MNDPAPGESGRVRRALAALRRRRPRIGVTIKLFLAVLATSVLVVVGLTWASSVSFERGFLVYVNESEAAQLEELTEVLAASYARRNDWNWLRRDQRRWRTLLVRYTRYRMLNPTDEQSVPAPGETIELALRLSLLDAQLQLVAGNPQPAPNARMQPILVNGQQAGWLAVSPSDRLSNAVDLQFQGSQRQATWVIGLLSVLLAGLVALMLARMFLSPVQRLARGTRRLAAGDFRIRLPVQSRDELGQLATSFNSLAQTLERNERLRREFMADISHELRTPLAVLRGELESLQDGIRPLTPEALGSLQSEVIALGQLVNDLYELSLSDVGALSYQKRRMDLGTLLSNVLPLYREQLAARGLTLEVILPDEPMPVWGDPGRLRQLFINLLQNSTDYTDPGGRVRLQGRLAEGEVIVDVEDSAPGVPAEHSERIFERLFRLDASRSRRRGGTGLGLAICRNIVQAHGGQISASPSALGGVWMQVRLPAG